MRPGIFLTGIYDRVQDLLRKKNCAYLFPRQNISGCHSHGTVSCSAVLSMGTYEVIKIAAVQRKILLANECVASS